MTDETLRRYDSILDLLPNVESPTPIVRLHRVTGFHHAQIYAKLEWYNPFGSVKDRVAANLVRAAEARGEEIENLVEPTSGNTGLGLAMIANARGYGFSATLSKDVPVEKRTALRLFGTDLVELEDDLCPMPGQPEGAMQRAADLAERPGWRELNQYENPDNPDAHYRTTGPEIWRQTSGDVTHFVASLGTCGTITGAGRFLKEQNDQVKVIGVHPGEGHDIPGVRSLRALAATEFFQPDEYDGVVEVGDDEAYHLALRLNREESIIAGPSSALALAGALRSVPDEPGVVVVVIFPDNAFKYASSFRRHLPDLFPAAREREVTTSAAASPFDAYLASCVRIRQAQPRCHRCRRSGTGLRQRCAHHRCARSRRSRAAPHRQYGEPAAAGSLARRYSGPACRQRRTALDALRCGHSVALCPAAAQGAGVPRCAQHRRWHRRLGGRGPADGVAVPG
jgi:cysteine synthase